MAITNGDGMATKITQVMVGSWEQKRQVLSCVNNNKGKLQK